MQKFYFALGNTLFANTTTNFLWFALVFWIYLETRSVIATSVIGGSYFILSSISGIFFGSFVDAHRKLTAIRLSSLASFVWFAAAAAVFFVTPLSSSVSLTEPYLWLFLLCIMAGAVAGNLRMIALSTLVTLLVPQKEHAHANGLVGTVNGISFAITSVFSGLAIGFLGMGWAVSIAVALMAVVTLHTAFLHFNEKKMVAATHPQPSFDLTGAWQAVSAVPGLRGLIIFSMLNNFFGGVFMALADAYGLELVAVETWGLIWGGLSVIFILGGVLVAKFGLTKRPLRLMFIATIMTWIAGMFFAVQPSIVLFIVGMIVYMLLVPAIEAAEQTVMQKVVPAEKQGRVFGFAQTAETLATPIMTLAIGPLTQLYFIPFMTTGSGVELIGEWFGTGVNRGIGLVFIVSSFLGLVVTVLAFRSAAYTRLAKKYASK